MHISIIKGIRLGSTNLQTHKDQREIKACLHIQNTKQITIINVFNKLAAVAADASLGLQICGPKPDSSYNGNAHYKMEGVFNLFQNISVPSTAAADFYAHRCQLLVTITQQCR